MGGSFGIVVGDTSAMPVGPLVVQLVATFLLAWLIGITATRDALLTAILIILTVAVFVVANGMFINKKTPGIVIESGFVIAMGIVMIAVHAFI